MTISKQYAEELSRQMEALEKENARLLNKIHVLEKDILQTLQTIYEVLSQRKKPAKKKRVK